MLKPLNLRRVERAMICSAAMAITWIITSLLPALSAQAATKTWIAGSGDWSIGANWNGGTAPLSNDTVFFTPTDGVARTLTYDVAAPNVGVVYIDLTGPGPTASTLSLPSDFNLTTGGVIVGGANSVALTNGRGELTQSGGTVTTLPVVGDVVVGYGVGSTGVYTLSGGAVVNSLNEYIGLNGEGTFNHSGGSNTINANATGALYLGTNVGSTGIYNLSGTGVLSTATDQTVGNSGFGIFNHTGGTNTISGATRRLYIARNSNSFGVYNIGGIASLASADVIVGSNGIGELTITDQASVHIINNLSINNLSSVQLNGGTLRFNTIGGIGGLSRLNYTAGTIQLAGNRDIIFDSNLFNLYGAARVIPAGKGLTVEGTTTIRQQKSVTVSGGTLTSQGTLIIGALGGDGNLLVNSGGSVIVNAGSTINNFGTASVSGAGSNWTIAGNLQISPAGDRGDLFVSNQGSLYIGAALSIGSSGTLNLNGGTIRFDGYSRNVIGNFAFLAGTVQLAGNRTLGSDAATLDLFGASPTIPTGKALVVEETALLTPSAPVTLAGGTLSANTVLMTPGSRLTNTVTTQVTGTILALAGSTIDARGGDLTLGDAGKVNGFYSGGTLLLGQRTVTLGDANDAVLDSAALVSLGAGGNPGTLVAANGLTLDFGGNITGFGKVDMPNDITKPLINNGHITGDSVGAPITLTGYVKGVGTLDNVNLTGTFAPGLSPTILVAGNLAFAPTSTLVMELGGATPGSGHDQILSSGALDLDGTLVATLINGFTPVAGQSFNLFDWNTVSGAFAALQLPALVGGLAWDTSQLDTTGVLSVVSAGIPGDYNNNGTVDAADYTLYRDHLGTNTTLPNDTTPGSVTAADYAMWQANFGQGGPSAAAAVPEPASVVLLLLFAVSPRCLCLWAKRSTARRRAA